MVFVPTTVFNVTLATEAIDVLLGSGDQRWILHSEPRAHEDQPQVVVQASTDGRAVCSSCQDA